VSSPPVGTNTNAARGRALSAVAGPAGGAVVVVVVETGAAVVVGAAVVGTTVVAATVVGGAVVGAAVATVSVPPSTNASEAGTVVATPEARAVRGVAGALGHAVQNTTTNVASAQWARP